MWRQWFHRILCVAIVLAATGGAAHGAFDPLKDPDLLGWWTFDEGSGTAAADSSPNGNDGTLNGGAEWVPGVYGTAINFNGSDAYVGTGQSLLDNADDFTMAGWVMARNSAASRIGLFGQNDLIEMGFMNGNTEVWTAASGTTNTPWTFPDTEWHHIAVVDQDTDMLIYIDGEQLASGAGAATHGTSSFSVNIGGGGVWDGTGNWFDGQIDDVAIFSRALTPEEIAAVMLGVASAELAFDPVPPDEAIDVPRDDDLSWTPGEFAVTHDVYLGTSLEDVNGASRGNPMDVLVSQDQAESTFDPGRLEFGRTYYWRIDEVNGAPDNTIFKGDIWSFEVEPFAYPVQNIVATSNAISEEGVGPERTVDGSGLNADDQHSIVAEDMWLGVPAGADPIQLLYEFDQIYKLHEMLVWNYNVQFEMMLGFGLKDVTIEYSENGTDWTVLGDVVFAQATARADYVANTTVEFGGVAVKAVRFTVNSGYGPLGQFGLSEVRFLFIPAHAREPQPADGETDVSPNDTVAWRAGREAALHEVYLSTDEAAVADGTALVDTVTESSLPLGGLDVEFGSTYFWKINEVNETEAITTWQGAIWSFATEEFALIDGFEDYDDDNNRIYDTWIDGFTNGTGSTVGYFEAPFAETSIVNSGRQSMPLEYNNMATPFYSEGERELDSINLTTNAADSLRLFVAGQAPAFAETADGTILMNGIGVDIWDTADEFRYAYKQLTGNGSMVALVEDLDASPNTWVKAGVMIRQSTEGGSAHTMTVMTGGGGNGASWQGRLTNNASSVNNDATTAVEPPYWVRVDRAGDSLTGFISPDGETWTQLGDARTITMDDPVLIGLALTSHNTAQATSAEFSNVSFTGNVTADWQIAEVGVTQPEGNTPESLYVALEDTSGNVAVATHPDPSATARFGWNEWIVPFSDLGGVNLSSVAIVYVGVGDRDNPTAGGTGLVFIDDIGYGRPAAPADEVVE